LHRLDISRIVEILKKAMSSIVRTPLGTALCRPSEAVLELLPVRPQRDSTRCRTALRQGRACG
jgi:hypothetical protein